jgi:predicted transposase/invertase (TIGR01784 family)
MYDSSLKYKWDNKNVLDYAMKEGMEIGERKKALEIARACKKMGMSTENIAGGTGLSIEEIESL